MIMIKKYIIYEHDHKYLKSRNPSIFPMFDVPQSELINVQFYKKAHKVVVLSEICKTILEKSLKTKNVINIGCSLWSNEKLDFIESIVNTRKTKENMIIDSPNPVKGTRSAISYCTNAKLDYDLIGQSPEKELLRQMSKYKTFIFVPQVLETLSRIVVEAKMLGCNIMTVNKLIGASYEPWFSKNGIELIKEMRKKLMTPLKPSVIYCRMKQ